MARIPARPSEGNASRRWLALGLAASVSVGWGCAAGLLSQGATPGLRGYSAVAQSAFTALATRPPGAAPAPQAAAPIVAAAPVAARPSGVVTPVPPRPAAVAPVPSEIEVPPPPRIPAEFDVFIALDVSESTKRPTGADLDGDGQIGRGAPAIPLFGALFDQASDDPGDSVLACEIKAAKMLLGQLDPNLARVGIIAFSGTRASGRATEPDARVVAPLTRNYTELANRLDELLDSGPRDQANLMAAVQLVTGEFERGFKGDPDRDVARIGLLISDGRATLPALLSSKARTGAAPASSKKAKDPDIMALEETLSENLGLKVSITDRGQSGDITITYESLSQLDGILKKLGGTGGI